MVCGSPSRGSSLVSCLAVVIAVCIQFHPVGSYHGDSNDTGVYYEQYPFNKISVESEHKINQSDSVVSVSNGKTSSNNWKDDGFSVNCTEPTIQDFPGDMFTQEQRQKGEFSLSNAS